MPRLLVVDDEPSVLYSFRRVFGNGGVEVLTAAGVAEGLRLFHDHCPDVVVLDLQMPDGSGLEAFEGIRAAAPRLPVVFITAHGTTRTAIEAMKHGAFDYLVKPVDFERVSEVLQRAFAASRLMHVPAGLPTLDPLDPFVGRSPIMQEMCKAIGRAAPQDVNVLILGESGVGKELVARALHQHGRRANRPYLAVNCAALPENLVESELFGHEKGAFTGAAHRRIGKFEQCNGGTVFLDEIGDMPLPAQAKILRLLQEQRFERVGGAETVQTQVRVLAATNQNLEQRITEGRFRCDLYYRLKVVTIEVPPLRNRDGDIVELAHHFLLLFNRELGTNFQGFNPEGIARLRQYRWPGNVRELQSAIKEAMLRCAGPLLLPEFLPAAGLAAPVAPAEVHVHSLASGKQPNPPVFAAPAPTPAHGPGPNDIDVMSVIDGLLSRGENDLHAKVLRVVERALFTKVLQETHGQQKRASDRLGLNRTTLRYKLRDLGLSVDRSADQVQEPSEGRSEQSTPPLDGCSVDE